MKSPQNNCPDALYRASQRRVAELERALQDASLWAYTSGELSEIDDLLEKADVPIPDEIATRNRMIEAWKEGFRKHHGWTVLPEEVSPEKELTWMLHYASQLHIAPNLPKDLAREMLWKLARAASNLLSPDLDVLALALEEYIRSTEKHPGMTLDRDGHTESTRLFALVEEIGEVAACLTYDNDAETGHGSDLESEVIQVIALALAWATRYLDEGGYGL
nr:MAG TPA: hypothetical protein [Caudoviricetes sp.]